VEEHLLKRCEEIERNEDDACKKQQAGSSGSQAAGSSASYPNGLKAKVLRIYKDTPGRIIRGAWCETSGLNIQKTT
jgi:hypothetical protein